MQRENYPLVKGIADVLNLVGPTSTTRAALIALMTRRTNMSDRLACLVVDCRGINVAGHRFIIDHGRADANSQVVRYYAGKIFNYLSFARR